MQIDGCSVHFTYDGDFVEVGKWLAFAKHLFATLPRRGLIADEKVPVEGVFIRVVRMGGANRIYIKAGGCPPLVSGLVDLKLPPKPVSTIPDIVWDVALTPGAPTKQYLYRLWEHVRKDGGDSYGPWSYNQTLARNYTKDTADKANSVLSKTPGKYTGAMRQVVQVIIGQGSPVPYDFTFSRSHGIYKTPDGKPWVIEVSQANGVLAWPLPTCGSTKGGSEAQKKVRDALGYYPTASAGPIKNVEQAVATGTAIRLLSASALTDVYAKTPFFPECGWAFSPSGAEAQNTCWDKPGTWKVSYRYKISITSAGNKPANATLSLVDSNYLHGPVEPDIKFPVYALNTLVSFDTLYGTIGNPPPGQGDAPLYVFYDMTGQEVVVNYYVQSGTSSNVVNDGVPSSPPTAAEIRKGEFLIGTQNSYTIQGPCIAGLARPKFESYLGAFYNFELTMRPDRPISRTFGGVPSWSISTESADVIRRFLAGNSGFTSFSEFSVVIPFLDREAAIFAERRVKHLFALSVQRYFWIALHGLQIEAGIGDGGCDVIPWPPGASRRIQPGGTTADLVTDYVRSGMTAYTGPTSPCAFVFNTDLGSTVSDDHSLSSETNLDTTEEVFRDATIVNSSGSFSMGPFDSTSIVHAVSEDSYAHCVADSFSKLFFASKELNSYSGDKYFSTINDGQYPITTLDNGTDRFFIGLP